MANEFVIKNGYLSRGDSEITGSLIISGSGSPLISLPDAPQNAAIISGSSGTTSVYIYDSVDGLRTPTYDKGAGLRLVSGEGTGQATLDVSAVGSDNGGSSNEQAFIRSNQMLSLYGEGNAAGDNIRLRGSSGYVALDSTTAGTSLTFVTNGGSTPSTIALGSFAGSAGVQITAPANNTYLRFIQGANTWLDLTSTKATFLADVSSSATSTASFGTYLGDGSQLTGIDTGSWDGLYTGSAEITGSLIVTGGITGSLFGTASWADNATTASYVMTAETASYVLPLVQDVTITGSLTVSSSLEVIGSQIISGTLKVHGGNVDITSNAYFFQGTNTSNGNVSLIGVNNQDQVYIGNQGYTNILADETHVRGDLQVTGSLLVTGSTNLNGSLTTKTTRITASSYTASVSDYRIAIRYTDTGSVSVQLPLISQIGQLEYKFKDEEGNAALNNITIVASGSDSIDGDSTAILNRNYMAIGLYNDGVSNWYIE